MPPLVPVFRLHPIKFAQSPKYPAANNRIFFGFCPCFLELIAVASSITKNGPSASEHYINLRFWLMENDNRLPTGEWNGFYVEDQRSPKGWMHLYLRFEDGKISGEGTDYVGPWVASGTYERDSGKCNWVKESSTRP